MAAPEEAVRLNHRLGSKIRPREITGQRQYYTPLQPSGTIPVSAGGVLTFNVQPSSNKFLDLESSYMEINAIMTNFETVNPGNDQFGAPPCDGLKTGYGDLLWSQVNCRFNTELLNDISSSFNFYQSFLRRAIEKPASWQGPNSYLCASGGAPYGQPSASNPNDGYVVQITTPGGAGDMMGYNLINGPVEAAKANKGPTEAENCPNSTLNSALRQRQMRIFANVSGNFVAGPTTLYPLNFTFYSWPANAFSTLSQLVPADIPIFLEFTRSPASLYIQTNNSASSTTLTLNSIQLWLRYVEPTDLALTAFKQSLIERPLSIPYTRCVMGTLTCSASQTTISQSGLCGGVKPDIIIISIHLASSLVGSYINSPFATKQNAYVAYERPSGTWYWPDGDQTTPQNEQLTGTIIPQVQNMQITWGGVVYPQIALTTPTDITSTTGIGSLSAQDFNETRAYQLYTEISNHGLASGSTPFLSYNQFISNYGFYCFDLRATTSYETGAIGDVKHVDEVVSTGSLSVTMNFQTGPKYPLTILVSAFGGGSLLIDAGYAVRRVGF